MEQVAVGGHRVGRKATVANYLRCDSLRNFLRAIFQYLKIRMAVRIDETRGDRQPVTVNSPRVGGRLKNADPLNRRAGDQYINQTGRRTRAVDDRSAFEDNRAHVLTPNEPQRKGSLALDA